MASANVAPSTPSLGAKLSQFWQNMTRPVAGLNEEEHARANYLTNLLFGSFLIFGAGASIFLIGLRLINVTVVSDALTLGSVLFIFIAYIISRTRYYEISAYMMVLVAMFGIALQMILFDNDVIGVFFLFTPLISSFLLKLRETFFMGLLSSVFYIVLYVLEGETAFDINFVTTLLIIVMVTVWMTYSSARAENQRRKLADAAIALREQVSLANEARDRAERADKVKSAFLASMSHELRTPLNAVINFTRFVVDGDTGPVNEQQKELLTDVIGSAKHLLNLINDVLDMSKIESGSLTLFIEEDIDLQALLKTTISTGNSLLAKKGVTLTADIPDNLPRIRGDKQRILQIMLNIMSNACKFTDKGSIVVKAQVEDDEVVISIKDTGPGIAPSDHEKVFQSFQQTATGVRKGGGTGLGMPIAKSLTEAHGGRLWLESQLGQGACFFTALPIQSNQLVPSLA